MHLPNRWWWLLWRAAVWRERQADYWRLEIRDNHYNPPSLRHWINWKALARKNLLQMGFKDCCVFCLLDLLVVFIVLGRMFGFASTREKRSWFDMEWLDLWRTTMGGYWGGVWLAEVSSTVERDVDYYCSFGVLLPSPSILWIHLQWHTRIIEYNEVQTSWFTVSELGTDRRRSWLRWCSVNAFARSRWWLWLRSDEKDRRIIDD